LPETSRRSLAIVGAGPIGLEAASIALEMGFDAHVFERGDVGAHALAWGHVRMFTPWRMNIGPASARLLARHGWPAPEADALPTGAELAERMLAPLAATPELKPRVHTHAQVAHVSRHGARKQDPAGPGARAEHPFRLLVRDAGGRESFLHAQALIDASGVLGQPLWAGTGGIPARGETYLAPQMSYQPDDVLGLRRERYAGKATLVIGGGSSAVTTVGALEQLARETPGTRVTWVTRRETPGFAGEVASDSLPARAALYAEGRRFQAGGSPHVRWWGGGECEGLEYNSATHRYRAQFATGAGAVVEEADQVIVNCGFGPDTSLYRELRVHESCETLAPMKLADALRQAGTSDCAKVPAFDAATLANPEPGFFILGAKSYGRSSAFLLETGYRQAAGVLAALAEAAGLPAAQETSC
jgi:thioredoxin reductase